MYCTTNTTVRDNDTNNQTTTPSITQRCSLKKTSHSPSSVCLIACDSANYAHKMGGKRGNENAQMSKEDYEAMQARRDDDSSPVVTQGFQRASAEELQRRRRVKARRPPVRPEGQRDAGASSASANPFAHLGSMFPTTSASKPSFAFGLPKQSTTADSTKPVPNNDTTTAVAGPVKSPALGTVSTNSSDPSTENRAFSLEKALKDSLKKLDPQMDESKLSRLDRIIQSAAKQIHEWAMANPETTPANDDADTQESPKGQTKEATKDNETDEAK